MLNKSLSAENIMACGCGADDANVANYLVNSKERVGGNSANAPLRSDGNRVVYFGRCLMSASNGAFTDRALFE